MGVARVSNTHDVLYWIFSYDHYYPTGGLEDFRGAYSSLEAAQKAAEHPEATEFGPHTRQDYCYIAEVDGSVPTHRYWTWDKDQWKEAKMTDVLDSPTTESTTLRGFSTGMPS